MSDDCMSACCAGCVQGICIACFATVASLCCDIVCRPVCGRCCNSCFDRCEDCCGCGSRRKQRSYSYESAARDSDGGEAGGNYSSTYDPPIAVVPVKVQPVSLSPSSEGYSVGDVQGYQAPPQATVVSSSGYYSAEAPGNQEIRR